MNKRIPSVVLALASLTACTTNVGDESENTPAAETVGTTSQAMTILDNCAKGSDPNARGSLLTEGAQDSYTRIWQYIENICPALDPVNARATTFVDFNLAAGQALYQFELHESFWVATNPAQCALLRSALRVQRRVGGTWVTDPGDYREEHGAWTWNYSEPNLGHCSVPGNYLTKVSFGGGETFRVRAWARQWDDSFATVQIKGINRGD